MTDEEIQNAIKNVKGISGMSTNERLYESGLIDFFEKCRINDKPRAKKILLWLGLDELSIDRILI